MCIICISVGPYMSVHVCGGLKLIEDNPYCFSALLIGAGSLSQTQSSLIGFVLPASLLWGAAF